MTERVEKTSSNCGDGWRLSAAWLAAYVALWLLAMAPANVWIAAYVAIAPLAWASWRARAPWRAGVAAWLASWALFLWLTRWTVPVTAMGYPLLAAYLATYPAIFAWSVRSLRDWPRTAGLPMAVIAPTVWAGLEVLRGNVMFGGFPWHMLGHPVVEAPVMAQSADLFGGYVLSALAAMTAGVLVDVLRAGRGEIGRGRLIGSAACAAVIIGVNLGYGVWRLGQKEPLSDGPLILAMQTNVPQDNKNTDSWDERVASFVDMVLATDDALVLTEKDFGAQTDLIAWPETMVPGFGFDRPSVMALRDIGADGVVQVAEVTIEAPGQAGAPYLVGSQAYEGLAFTDEKKPVWDRNYNAAYLISPDRSIQRYDKVELTPFGESMPVISKWEWLEQRLLALGANNMPFNLDAAAGPTLLRLVTVNGTWRVGTPICYEASTPWLARGMANVDDGAMAFFVNPSNDGWFGDFQGPRERLVQALRIRCIENRRPMVRSVNTGLSVAIDSRGIVVERVGPGRYGEMNRTGHLATRVVLDGRHSVYRRVGDAPAYGLLAMTILALGGARLHRRRGSRRDPASVTEEQA